MSKIIILSYFFVILFWPFSAKAQEGVAFLDNPLWSDLLAEAGEKGKSIMVDCYTSWCAPCRQMAEKVFTQKAIGDYLNERFVCAKIDMEKGEGKSLAKKYNVRAYPTFLYLTRDGELISSATGGCSADEFIERTERIMSGNTLSKFQSAYDKGERGEDFMYQYITTLSENMKSKEAADIASEVLKGKKSELLDSKNLYNLFLRYVRDPMDETFMYVHAHQKEFKERYDAVQLDEKLYMTWLSHTNDFIRRVDAATWDIDEDGLAAYFEKMNAYPTYKARELELRTKLLVEEYKRDWDRYAVIGDEAIRKQEADDGYIYNWAMRINNAPIKPETRAMILSWVNGRIASLKKCDSEKSKQYLELYEELALKIREKQ